MRKADRPKVPTMRWWLVRFVDGTTIRQQAEHRGAARYYALRSQWLPARKVGQVVSARLDRSAS